MSSTLVPEPATSVFDAVLNAVGDEQSARAVMANPALAGRIGSRRADDGYAGGGHVSGVEPSRPDESVASSESTTIKDTMMNDEPQNDMDHAIDRTARDESNGASASSAGGAAHGIVAEGGKAGDAGVGETAIAAKATASEATTAENGEGIPLKAVDEIGRATAADVREALHQVIDPELGIDVIDLGLVYGIEIDELGRAIITMTLTTPACPLTDLIEDECASILAGLVEEFRIDWTWQPRWTTDMITPEGRDQLAAIGFNLDAMPRY